MTSRSVENEGSKGWLSRKQKKNPGSVYSRKLNGEVHKTRQPNQAPAIKGNAESYSQGGLDKTAAKETQFGYRERDRDQQSKAPRA
jgi:hypothetical protein